MNISLRPVFTFLAVFIIGGTFLVATSGNSLPGEPLYPVKQLWEAARLALTADPQVRQLIEEELRQERIEELRALIESGREQLFTFEARLETVQASRIVVDGFTVLVNRQTVWQDQPVVGQMVRLEVYIQGNGTMTARRIQPVSAGQVITPTPTVQATSCNNFTCETVTPGKVTPTAEVTPTPTPADCNFGACPTETGEPTAPPTVTPSPTDGTPNATPTVCNFGFCGTITPTPTPTAAGQATATATPIPTWTPTPCNNPSCGEPTDEPTPPNDTATPAPVTATPSVTPACPPVGCNEPTATPTPAVTASATPVPPATPTPAGNTPSPTPCNGGACEPPTPTPAGITPSPTPCNGGICEPPTATPWETVTPTAVPTDTPDPLPSPTPCNWGVCGGPSEPTYTPNP